ncbi:MAG: fimbria major subunit, partial [Muribaculaceae bacterium]|nr:fimbria major subunit [Muribaculaceae bacterium]
IRSDHKKFKPTDMKKIQFAAGFFALAMLGACSSDAPEVITPDVSEGDGDMYFAISVVGANANTRAEGDGAYSGTTQGSADEDAISKVQILITDELENLYYTKTATSADIANGVVTFGVSNALYEDMLAKAERGADMNIVVYANGVTISTANQLLHGSTNDATWGKIGENHDGYNEAGFIMSNAKECKGAFEKNTANAAGTKADPWLIKANIELARLATRFDYVEQHEGKYTPAINKDMEYIIQGLDVETFATTTYRIPTFSEDGKMPSPITTDNHCHYTPKGTNTYRVTDVVTAGTTDEVELGKYVDYNYTMTSTKPTKYRRPNTVSTEWEWDDAKANYRVAPFAVVKVEFINKNFAQTGKASLSQAAGEEVYGANGLFIGGWSDFKELRKNKKQFVFTYSEESKFTEQEKTKIRALINDYNELLKRTLPSEYNDGRTEADDIEYFKNYLNGKYDCFKPVKDADGKAHYYCYYASLIEHDATSIDPCWKYGVSRNVVYKLSVDSFKALGNNGDGVPGDGPSTPDLKEMYIKMSVKVNAWNLNTANHWDL